MAAFWRHARKGHSAPGGDGADELWAGYEHYIGFKVAQWYNVGLPRCARGLSSRLPNCCPRPLAISIRAWQLPHFAAAHAPAWQRVQTMLTAFTPDMQQSILDTAFEAQQPGFLAPEVLFAPTREHYEHWQPQNAATPLARAFHVYARQFML